MNKKFFEKIAWFFFQNAWKFGIGSKIPLARYCYDQSINSFIQICICICTLYIKILYIICDEYRYSKIIGQFDHHLLDHEPLWLDLSVTFNMLNSRSQIMFCIYYLLWDNRAVNYKHLLIIMYVATVLS